MPPELCNITSKSPDVGTVSERAVNSWSTSVTLYCLEHGFAPFANSFMQNDSLYIRS